MGKATSNRIFLFIFIGILGVYVTSLNIDVMEIDAAQYALISKEMFQTGNYFELYCHGNDYLDKPPFLFWLNQIPFKLFGVHNWSYKLGSVLFLFLGIFSTYKLGTLLFDKYTGLLSAGILGTTAAWMLMANDVRTDGILASAIIFTVWQWKCFTINHKWKHLIQLSIGIGIGMLTKGPIGFIVPAIIIGIDQAIQKQWKNIFNWKYLIAGVIILICLTPMMYGLYQQFDLHPGKVINGQPINSGLRFYFWTQSFGRITGESQWENNASIFYFIPVIGWAFLPWIIFLFHGMYNMAKNGGAQRAILLTGFIFPLIALSLSRYKLPHYIFICFPFMAIIVGRYLATTTKSFLLNVLGHVLCLLIIAAMWLLHYAFHPTLFYSILFTVIAVLLGVVVYYSGKNKLVRLLFTTSITAFIYINIAIYPKLLHYQSQSQVAKFLAENVDELPAVSVGIWGYSMPFYGPDILYYPSLMEMINTTPAGTYRLYMNSDAFTNLQSTGFPIEEIKEFPSYPVSRLSLRFLNPKTREENISKTYLVKVHLPEKWTF